MDSHTFPSQIIMGVSEHGHTKIMPPTDKNDAQPSNVRQTHLQQHETSRGLSGLEVPSMVVAAPWFRGSMLSWLGSWGDKVTSAAPVVMTMEDPDFQGISRCHV